MRQVIKKIAFFFLLTRFNRWISSMNTTVRRPRFLIRRAFFDAAAQVRDARVNALFICDEIGSSRIVSLATVRLVVFAEPRWPHRIVRRMKLGRRDHLGEQFAFGAEQGLLAWPTTSSRRPGATNPVKRSAHARTAFSRGKKA